MAMQSFPFVSEVTYDEVGYPSFDRAVDHTVLRKIIKEYFSDGIFGLNDSGCFQVTAPNDGSMTVNVAAGACMIQGATGYDNSPAVIPVPAAHTSYSRIDTVVLRMSDNSNKRNIELDVVSGTAASSPTAPDLTRSSSVWELGLANITVVANSTTITQNRITDTRQNSARCGYVTAVQNIDTDILFQQYQSALEQFIERMDSDELAYMTAQAAAFQAWFELIQGQLSEDAAGHLQEQINNITFYYVQDNVLYLPNTAASISDGTLTIGTTVQNGGE